LSDEIIDPLFEFLIAFLNGDAPVVLSSGNDIEVHPGGFRVVLVILEYRQGVIDECIGFTL